MPWKAVLPMEQIMSFVLAVKAKEFGFAQLCRRYEISRKTGYKWWARYRADGLDGLYERGCRPRHCPHQSAGHWVKRLVGLRVRRPHWGPKKLRVKLGQSYGWKGLPAASTLGRILLRHGLVRSGRRRRRGGSARPWPGLTQARRANQVWAVDFKGWFRTGNGQRCEPLTVSDLYSRYVLECQAVRSLSYEAVKPVFERLFSRYGLPEKIRVDNGAPFASTGAGGLSRLSVWWLRLGIVPEFSRPGHPQDNGSHERMHRTLKAETTEPAAPTLSQQQARFTQWRRGFNQDRPHEALGQAVPQSRYTRSERKYGRAEPEVIYPEGYELRQVRSNGEIRWRGRLRYVGEALVGQTVGLRPVGAGRQQVCFRDWLLGDLDEDQTGGIRPSVRQAARHGQKGRRGPGRPKRVRVEQVRGRAGSRGPGESVTRGDRRPRELRLEGSCPSLAGPSEPKARSRRGLSREKTTKVKKV